MIDAFQRRVVRERAENRCEYCRLSQHEAPVVQFHIEHIRPRQHGGDDSLQNLLLGLSTMQLPKGPNVAAFDPGTNQLVPLFNPRTQTWTEHFTSRAGLVIGLTAIGRATVLLLQMNTDDRVDLRLNLDGDQRS